MTIKSKIAAAVFLSTILAAGAVGADEQCFLTAGCFWESGDASNPGRWVCPDPLTYMLCTDM